MRIAMAAISTADMASPKFIKELMPADMANSAPANLKPMLEREVQLYPGVTLLWKGNQLVIQYLNHVMDLI